MNAAAARQAANLTIEQAARKARIGVRYLKRIERHGKSSYVLAVRLSKLYACSITAFL